MSIAKIIDEVPSSTDQRCHNETCRQPISKGQTMYWVRIRDKVGTWDNFVGDCCKDQFEDARV